MVRVLLLAGGTEYDDGVGPLKEEEGGRGDGEDRVTVCGVASSHVGSTNIEVLAESPALTTAELGLVSIAKSKLHEGGALVTKRV